MSKRTKKEKIVDFVQVVAKDRIGRELNDKEMRQAYRAVKPYYNTRDFYDVVKDFVINI